MFRYPHSAGIASLDGEDVATLKARATIWSHEDGGHVTVAIDYLGSARGHEAARMPSHEAAVEFLRAHGFHTLPETPGSWVLEAG